MLPAPGKCSIGAGMKSNGSGRKRKDVEGQRGPFGFKDDNQ